MPDPHPNQPRESTDRNSGAAIDAALFAECVHCGLCTSACPTYTELGDENDGPRGRIYLMQLVSEGRLELTPMVRRHIDLCLDCRSCETACPSGVKYGRLVEPFRLAVEQSDDGWLKRLDWFRQVFLLRVFPYPKRLRAALAPVRLAQRMGIVGTAERLGLLRLIPGRIGHMIGLLPPPVKSGPRLPEFLPAVGRRRARVAMFLGCVADVLFRHTHWATARVLQQNGCDVVVPGGQGCCGAIHFHCGDGDGARRMADVNLAAFDLDDVDAIVVNHAGCGAMMKEYGLHWDDANRSARKRFSAKVKDIHQLLDELGPVPPSGRIEAVAAYHDACHLTHAQKVREPPRRLLSLIPGLELRDLPESEICCGSAGTYNLDQPAMADRLARRKVENIRRCGAQVVLAANAGCLLQIGREVRRHLPGVTVMHPIDLLDLSYRNEQPG